MKTKGQQFIENTSQHTFITPNNSFFRTVLYNYDNVEYVAILTFKEDQAYVRINTTEHYNKTSVNGKSYVNTEAKHALFPQDSKRKSIPTFKAMKETIIQVKEILQNNDPKQLTTCQLVEKYLKELNFKVEK